MDEVEWLRVEHDERCVHGRDEESLCDRCDRNKDCHWNDGNECHCEP